MKNCPFCAEEVQDAAIICKHCGKEIVPDKVAEVSHSLSGPKTANPISTEPTPHVQTALTTSSQQATGDAERPWYRQTWAYVTWFVILMPLWSILKLTDKNAQRATKILAGILLLPSIFLLMLPIGFILSLAAQDAGASGSELGERSTPIPITENTPLSAFNATQEAICGGNSWTDADSNIAAYQLGMEWNEGSGTFGRGYYEMPELSDYSIKLFKPSLPPSEWLRLEVKVWLEADFPNVRAGIREVLAQLIDDPNRIDRIVDNIEDSMIDYGNLPRDTYEKYYEFRDLHIRARRGPGPTRPDGKRSLILGITVRCN